MTGNDSGNRERQLDPRDTVRFWSSVEMGDDGVCWPWKRPNADGYGEFRLPDGLKLAHRIAYELTAGPIPAGTIVRHDCDNPACCNPRHLRTGTHADNVRDRVMRDRSAKGDDNGRARLTSDDVRRIRATPSDRWDALAVDLGVHRDTVKLAGLGKTWAHLPMGAVVHAAPSRPQAVAPPVDDDLIPIPDAAERYRVDLEHLRSLVARGASKENRLSDPIGSAKLDVVYGWSMEQWAKSASSGSAGSRE